VFTACLLVGGLAAPSRAADDLKPGLTTLSKASQTLLTAPPREPRLRANQQQTAAPTDSRQFFRSKKGATVVALLAAGFAYTLYSRFHDELKSPIREE
jgi:hypothetical protein